jgi:hypothetical protein
MAGVDDLQAALCRMMPCDTISMLLVGRVRWCQSACCLLVGVVYIIADDEYTARLSSSTPKKNEEQKRR